MCEGRLRELTSELAHNSQVVERMKFELLDLKAGIYVYVWKSYHLMKTLLWVWKC
jgi:hypothetical protein